MDTFWSKLVIEQPMHVSVVDPDLQGGRPSHPCLEIRGEPGLNFFSPALRASVWSKIKGEPCPHPPPPLGSATGSACTSLSGGCEEVSWSIFQSSLNTWSHSTNIAAQDFKLVRGLLPRNSQIRQHKGLCDPCQNKFLQDN